MKSKMPVLTLKIWIQILIVFTIGIYSFSQYYLNYKYIQELNREQIEQINSIVSTDLKTMMQFPLVTNDLETITRLTTDLLQHEMIWAIEVRDAQDRIIERAERSVDNQKIILNRQRIAIFDDRIPLVLDETGIPQTTAPILLGQVYIYFTNDSQVQSLNSDLQEKTLIFALITLVFSILLASFMINFSWHVKSAIAEMQKIIEGDYRIKIRRSRVIEFNTLGAKLEEVAHAFSEQVARLTKSKSEARKKQLEAEESNAAKIRFMQVISHEIRSPVHVIVNLFATITDDIIKNKPESIQQRLGLCRDSASELLTVIDEFLDVQAFGSGQVKIKHTEQSVNHTITDICSRYRQKFSLKKVNFEYEDDQPVNDYNAVFDKGKLDRILSNLIENALKYTRIGVVSLSWRVEIAEDTRLVIHVMDTGIGISTSDQLHIFDPFYQVNSPMIKQHSGRGIGLSIVKELAQLLNGTISVTSISQRGSTFTLSLPIEITKPLHATPAEESYLDKECSVLVIDDKEANCIVMMNMLKTYDIIPEYVTDPNTGLNKALRKRYDVILVDYHMPDLDGATLTKSIRGSSANADTVILCITADATVATQDTLIDTNNFDGIIVKPIDAQMLAERIEHALYAKHVSGKVLYGKL
jgi:signal transduction histidine kinase/ActR/RegA family two-component response regulator